MYILAIYLLNSRDMFKIQDRWRFKLLMDPDVPYTFHILSHSLNIYSDVAHWWYSQASASLRQPWTSAVCGQWSPSVVRWWNTITLRIWVVRGACTTPWGAMARFGRLVDLVAGVEILVAGICSDVEALWSFEASARSGYVYLDLFSLFASLTSEDSGWFGRDILCNRVWSKLPNILRNPTWICSA